MQKHLLLFFGLVVLVSCSTSFEYPKITKLINDHYYFTQQEYGWAGSMPGENLKFYEKKTDRLVGYIQWHNITGDFSAEIIDANQESRKRLLLSRGSLLVLDTILRFDSSFSFKYSGTN